MKTYYIKYNNIKYIATLEIYLRTIYCVYYYLITIDRINKKIKKKINS